MPSIAARMPTATVYTVRPTAGIAYSQDNSQYHLESAKTLAGNIYVVNIFVSDFNNQWTYEEKMQMIRLRNEALNWLQKQVSLYNTYVEFENGNFGLENDIELNYILPKKICYMPKCCFCNSAFRNVSLILFSKIA